MWEVDQASQADRSSRKAIIALTAANWPIQERKDHFSRSARVSPNPTPISLRTGGGVLRNVNPHSRKLLRHIDP